MYCYYSCSRKVAKGRLIFACLLVSVIAYFKHNILGIPYEPCCRAAVGSTIHSKEKKYLRILVTPSRFEIMACTFFVFCVRASCGSKTSGQVTVHRSLRVDILYEYLLPGIYYQVPCIYMALDASILVVEICDGFCLQFFWWPCDICDCLVAEKALGVSTR